ncbi:SOSS complex subunit B homolog [Cloeon dipterum]|uniref:SOSS complex subunit B homolog n=1 Tax=Cloeon dipterum TaxID=197152 RepID=UPI00321F97E8
MEPRETIMPIKDIRAGMKNLTLEFIILEIGLPIFTKENREVRSCKIADSSGCINMSIWDTPGQFLAPGDIVRATRAYATVYRNSLVVYSGKSGEVQRIGDYCMVFSESPNMSELPVVSGHNVQGQPPPPGNNGNNGGGNNGRPPHLQQPPMSGGQMGPGMGASNSKGGRFNSADKPSEMNGRSRPVAQSNGLAKMPVLPSRR